MQTPPLIWVMTPKTYYRICRAVHSVTKKKNRLLAVFILKSFCNMVDCAIMKPKTEEMQVLTMSQVVRQHLIAGFIFGDRQSGEYVYLPGGEVGLDEPLCVLETPAARLDVSLDEAVQLVAKLSLKPVKHPRLGAKSC